MHLIEASFSLHVLCIHDSEAKALLAFMSISLESLDDHCDRKFPSLGRNQSDMIALI